MKCDLRGVNKAIKLKEAGCVSLFKKKIKVMVYPCLLAKKNAQTGLCLVTNPNENTKRTLHPMI